MMYYWTLETVASDLYIDRYEELEKNLSLVALRKKVYNWTKEVSKVHFPIHLYISALLGSLSVSFTLVGRKNIACI